MRVNEKYRSLLDQYDLQVDRMKRGRGEMICDTNQGLFALSKTKLSQERIEEEYQWKLNLMGQGMYRIDQYIKNKENKFISYNKYYEPFVMRRSYRGSECDIHSHKDLGRTAENLAYFHKVSRGIEPNESQEDRKGILIEQFGQHERELKNIQKFIQKKKNKGAFEYLFLEEAGESLFQMKYSIEKMKELSYEGFGWCHGSYNHHKVILGKKEIATTHFERFYYGYPMVDVYYFLRKVLEKNNYDFGYTISVLNGYEKIKPLKSEDYTFLYLLFCYPEKFWRISNQYMNHKKCWVLPRYLNKLTEFVELNKKRTEFLDKYLTNFNVILG